MNDNNFFSVDRLVEFGMGMAMAQQMVGMMNQTMQQMYVPGSIQSMPRPAQQNIYYVGLGGQPVGPLNDAEIAQMVAQRKINKDTLAWMPGMAEWKPVEQVPEILKIIALTPPAMPQQNNPI